MTHDIDFEIDTALTSLDRDNNEIQVFQPPPHTYSITPTNVKDYFINNLLLPLAKENDGPFKVITHHSSKKERLNLLHHSYDVQKCFTQIVNNLIKKILRDCNTEADIYKINEKFEEKLNDAAKRVIEVDELVNMDTQTLDDMMNKL